jgi:hypothetical protein
MAEVDRNAYDEWLEWEIERRRIGRRVLERIVDTGADTFEPLTYDEWLKAGKPHESRVRSALVAFFGRQDLMEPPKVM